LCSLAVLWDPAGSRPALQPRLEGACLVAPVDEFAQWGRRHGARIRRTANIAANGRDVPGRIVAGRVPDRVPCVPVDCDLDPVALRSARVCAGLTQHELARIIGVAGGERISRWELGTSAPRPEMLHRLAEVLGLGVDDLLVRTDRPADLRRLRTAAGLSARDLAARAHLSVPTYVRWESGRMDRLPSGPALTLLAAALDATVEDVQAALVATRANARRFD